MFHCSWYGAIAGNYLCRQWVSSLGFEKDYDLWNNYAFACIYVKTSWKSIYAFFYLSLYVDLFQSIFQGYTCGRWHLWGRLPLGPQLELPVPALPLAKSSSLCVVLWTVTYTQSDMVRNWLINCQITLYFPHQYTDVCMCGLCYLRIPCHVFE